MGPPASVRENGPDSTRRAHTRLQGMEADLSEIASARANGTVGQPLSQAEQQRRPQGIGRTGFWQPWLVGECWRQPDIDAIAGDEYERNLQRIQPLGERKRGFA